MTKKIINSAIIGASGYTASELLRIINNHPNIAVKYLIGNSQVNKSIKEIYPYLKFANLPDITSLENIDFDEIELVFCCLPHGETSNIIAKIPAHVKIIDLSADYRVSDANIYHNFYDNARDEKLLDDAIYGLSEIYANEIKKKRIIACPGCYPTAILLPLIPLVKEGLISKEKIIIDAKTGISGAGRKVAQELLFCEINENFIPYNVTKHRHLAEIFEQLDITAQNIQFTPQIIPTSRGIMAVSYVDTTSNITDIRSYLHNFYQNEKFVKVNLDNDIPILRNVINTNFCEISVVASNIPNQIIIFSIIDNLTKGSSGQAIQNFNLIYGLELDTGLNNLSVYP